NDKFGHQSGDNALASIAATVKECIRDSDVLFRYGGEEFVILFHKTDLMGSVMVAEKIRERVAASRTHLVNDVYADKSKRVKVTVSIGLAEIKPEDGAESWFQRADEAMYRSKDKGRDRVTTAPKNA
ncbi:MAG: GGDEF domain-containing protein, partial [Nitrospinaceae bacterium]